MAKEILTDEQVEQEIERLLKSDDVKLAKKEQQIRNRKRQYMYQLRWLEKRGQVLKGLGVTMHTLESLDKAMSEDIGTNSSDIG